MPRRKAVEVLESGTVIMEVKDMACVPLGPDDVLTLKASARYGLSMGASAIIDRYGHRQEDIG